MKFPIGGMAIQPSPRAARHDPVTRRGRRLQSGWKKVPRCAVSQGRHVAASPSMGGPERAPCDWCRAWIMYGPLVAASRQGLLLYMNTDTRTTNAAIHRRNTIGALTNQHAPQAGEQAVSSMSDLDMLNNPALDDARRTDWGQLLAKIGFGLLTLGVLVGGWWLLAVLGNYPPYILPTPPLVAERAWEMILSGSLIGHFWTTFLEAGLGFLLALVVGVGLGYPIAHSRLLEKLITPYIGVSQGLPVVALAPFLVIWFKDDLMRNIIVVTLIVFLPLLVNTIVGLRNIDRSMLEVARISGANFWQTIWYVELPLSLRALLGGIKLGVTLSITGAVVGELISANSGLGFLLAFGRGTFDISLMFVGLVSLALLTMLLYALVTVLEKVLIDSD